MAGLNGVVIATPSPDRLNQLVAELTGQNPSALAVDVVHAQTPTPPMALSVHTQDLASDLARCEALGFGEVWRSRGSRGQGTEHQFFVMTTESGGASILLVADATADPETEA